jgi:hypothetical protein
LGVGSGASLPGVGLLDLVEVERHFFAEWTASYTCSS